MAKASSPKLFGTPNYAEASRNNIPTAEYQAVIKEDFPAVRRRLPFKLLAMVGFLVRVRSGTV